MRIALFHNFYHQRGGEDVMFELEAAALVEAGHEVVTFTVHNTDEVSSAGIWRKANVALRAPFNVPMGDKVQAFLEKEKPDVGHVHNWFPQFSPSIYRAHAKAGVPVVQTLHNYRLGCANGTYRKKGKACDTCSPLRSAAAVRNRCYRGSLMGSFAWKRIVDRNWRDDTFTDKVDAYICPSQEVKNRHLKMGIPDERLIVVPNTCHDPIRQSANLTSPNTGKVLFLGRLVREKGPEVLLKAWTRVIQRHPDAKLDILGDGPQRDELELLYGSLSGVTFHGQVDREGVEAAIEQTGVVVFPGLWAEPFGLGVIEALAAGRPVIASNLGGPAEIIGEKQTFGRLVPPGNPDKLAEALIQHLDNGVDSKRMSKMAREEFMLHYTPEAHVLRLMQVYRSLTMYPAPSCGQQGSVLQNVVK
jgi:glycosyltransferase involved in cell wall biosynthesis